MVSTLNNEILSTKTTQRNIGIDLLRIFSMLMVVILHVLDFSGLLSAQTGAKTLGYIFVWGLEAFAICAVNVFAMISGYVCYESKFKLKRVIKLWLEVAFYSVTTYVIGSLISNNFSVNLFLKSFLPVIFCKYWYFTAYFLVMLLSPLFNIAIKHMQKTQHFCLILLIFVISIITLVFSNLWQLNGGFSFLWLAFLYCIGAYFKKYGFLRINKIVLLLIYIGASICILILGMFINHCVYDYPTIFVLIQAIALINIFGQINFKKLFTIKFIEFLSPLAFGVYLIHESPEIKNLLYPKLSFIKDQSVWLYIPLVIGCAIAIYVACSIIEYLRQLFFKYARINKLCDTVGDWTQTKFTNLLDKKLNK